VRTGGKLVVDQLVVHGVDVAYGVPGESYLAVLDALYDAPIRFVACRHEVGAANMADAYGKLTGHPGICMVTRGPGATHAAGGIHTAFQDSTPLILLIGQVARDMMGREAFQEIDYRHMFGPMAKWVAQIDSADQIPELLSRAFHVATSGRPGPVVLALPEDMLVEESDASDARPYEITRVHPAPADLERVRALLAGALRPLVVVGGAPWSAEAHEELTAWCAASCLPVASGWRRQDYVDNSSDAYVGHLALGADPRLAQRVRDADVLLVIGDRLSEITTAGYTLLRVPDPAQALVHVSADPDELGRVYAPALAIAASPETFARALAALPPLNPSTREKDTLQARSDYLDNLRHDPMPGALDMGDVMATVRARLPADAIFTNGAGNFSVWAHRFYEFRDYPTQLAPTSGAMGYGVPAAVAAKLLHPERIVVAIAGDGDFLMTGQELATAVQYEAPIVVLLVNNGMYGTIRMHQERHYPGRVSGTDLVNPDFAKLAEAFGAFGIAVERTEDFAAAFDAALGAGRPAVIELRVDPEALTPRQSLSQIREQALARLATTGDDDAS
jgi:acetolactate synthase-1/2/3 large subunit